MDGGMQDFEYKKFMTFSGSRVIVGEHLHYTSRVAMEPVYRLLVLFRRPSFRMGLRQT